MFVACIALLVWQTDNPDGFNTVWKYFGLVNQTLATFCLWTVTCYLVIHGKPFVITLVPALFMTCVCSTFLFVSHQALGMEETVGNPLGLAVMICAGICFGRWYKKFEKNRIQ